MRESEFDRMANEAGAKVYKNGWPDRLIIDKDGNIILSEVKQPKDKLRKSQVQMHDILNTILKKAGLPKIKIARTKEDAEEIFGPKSNETRKEIEQREKEEKRRKYNKELEILLREKYKKN